MNNKLPLQTPNLTAQNIDKIAALFPNCITEMLDEEKSTPDHKVYKRGINFELLKQMLSPDVVDGDEAYEFTWVGKKASIVEANKPIRKTLRPCPAESKNWDDTENLYIEGDNLEVLKLLQESYLGKVKMIYIDPPYNTGNDFIYADDFMRSQDEENRQMGMYDEDENRLFKNNDSNGRFHSDWCSMMYSRLMLARNLLTDDGAILISIDDFEQDHANHAVQVAEEVADCAASVIDLLDSVYSDKVMLPENARSNNVELKIDPDKLAMPEFKALWNKISPKSVYVVDFDTDELVQKSIRSLNRNLNVSKIYFKVESGEMTEIKSKDSLLDGSAFAKADQHKYDPQTKIHASQSVKYDLIGKLVAETKLTRKAIVQILVGIEKAVFDQFKDNPEEFILKAAALINDEKATAIIQHITYNILDEHYDTDIFTEPTLKGKLGMNVMKVQRHLYDHLIYDSSNERDFAADLDTNRDVAVYIKLPDGFYISTPVGKYNPDWAIAFYEGTVKHIYFVAETKGTLDSMKLNHITPVEQAKIDCARAHFKALNDENVVYDVVSDYQTLLNAVMK